MAGETGVLVALVAFIFSLPGAINSVQSLLAGKNTANEALDKLSELESSSADLRASLLAFCKDPIAHRLYEAKEWHANLTSIMARIPKIRLAVIEAKLDPSSMDERTYEECSFLWQMINNELLEALRILKGDIEYIDTHEPSTNGTQSPIQMIESLLERAEAFARAFKTYGTFKDDPVNAHRRMKSLCDILEQSLMRADGFIRRDAKRLAKMLAEARDEIVSAVA